MTLFHFRFKLIQGKNADDSTIKLPDEVLLSSISLLTLDEAGRTTYSPAAITGYLSSIESLSGTNFRKWKEQISIILGVMDLDYALRVDAPAALTAESSTEQKAAYEKWERSNRISLMIMKGSITTAIRGAIPDSDNAKLYLAHIEEQFQGSSKAHATTLITKMVTLKYSGSNGVREHILRMNDMASQLKGLDMEISEGFLVHFIMTSLPAQFGPFKINYNTQKEKWKMSELISMCVQEEERLKSEQPDSAHVAITGPSKGKGKGKKFGKGNVQGNKSASVTKTDKASSSGTKGSSGPRCHLCKDKGRMRKECHKFREWLEKKDSNDLDYGVKMNDINSNTFMPKGTNSVEMAAVKSFIMPEKHDLPSQKLSHFNLKRREMTLSFFFNII
ncbi:hypothetical protein RJ639_022652 [Escallonia herrerae]|uniref:UBN2_2 domain-containing protein n=1 Tax=Escallonia herrerae TaxID=1293975 RepID=A0AA89ACY9_9ASTE|nr:hypothetical protein RJ639_022652 [Escallonia herrerae]